MPHRSLVLGAILLSGVAPACATHDGPSSTTDGPGGSASTSQGSPTPGSSTPPSSGNGALPSGGGSSVPHSATSTPGSAPVSNSASSSSGAPASNSASHDDSASQTSLGLSTPSELSETSANSGDVSTLDVGETSDAEGGHAGAVTWPVVNGVQWADTNGNPIQAHGGGILKVGDEYFWFGENRNADSTFYAVSAYRSRDLMRWEHAHDVLTMNSDPGLKPANVERPKVVYNAKTRKFVMWMHWENGKDYGEARAAVASSDTVDGDYTYHGSFRPLQDSGVSDHGKPGYMSRDCTLFVDDDGKGYFISAANENYDLHVYALSEDYLSVASRVALLFEGGHREAPALFKRGDTYFLLTSGSTGWSPNQAQYSSSRSLTSGWSALQNVADENTFYSQSTFVLPVAGAEGTQFLYMGDRWAGAWSGRVNDSTYVWQPITFPSSTSMSMTWNNHVELDPMRGAVAGATDAFTFRNKKSGLVLAVDGTATENGDDLVQAPPATAAHARWRLNYDGAGYFRITNEDSQKIIDVPDESTTAGTHLHLWDSNGGDHQVWRIVDLGNGDFQLRNKKSGLYVGVTSGAVGEGASVEQQAVAGDEQIWQMRVAGPAN